ncbi:MAG: branched-chain amino acid transaminase [Anaerolineales bacterium]|nr:branched-chain amino acid transaminase [Anaerolineales bacterium]
MAGTNALIWMDGELVPHNEATVHFLSPALHYGLAAFEGIRCYDTNQGPAVFRLQEHLERFMDSALIFGILDFPYTVGDLRRAVHDVISANELKSCYIRPLIYMAEGPLGLNIDEMQPAVGIAAWEWGTFLGDDALETGARVLVSSYTRHHPNVSMTKAKISGNYVNSVMAKTLAARAGFDEAVMLDPSGFVAECTGENIFLVRDSAIYTPPRATILEGITRASIITITRDLGYEVIEETVSRDQLYIADEIFLSGTAAECVAVSEIDYRQIGSGSMGPITREIQETFFETVRGAGRRSEEWLDPIGSL